MMNTELKKSYWSDAAKAGAIMGGLLFAVSLADALFKFKGAGGMTSLASFAVLAVFIYRFGKDRSLKHGDEGFTFGQSMGYILAMMLFTGIISGFGNFLLQNYIAPDYYQELFEATLLKNPLFDPDSSTMADAMEMARKLMKNPVFLVLSGIIGMTIYGGLIGLLASAFIRKRPDMFANTDTTQDNDNTGNGNTETDEIERKE